VKSGLVILEFYFLRPSGAAKAKYEYMNLMKSSKITKLDESEHNQSSPQHFHFSCSQNKQGKAFGSHEVKDFHLPFQICDKS